MGQSGPDNQNEDSVFMLLITFPGSNGRTNQIAPNNNNKFSYGFYQAGELAEITSSSHVEQGRNRN